MRLLLVLCLLMISVNGFPNPWECMNNGTGTHFEANNCSYSTRHCGQRSNVFECASGLPVIGNMSDCTWAGRVCNMSNEFIWLHGGRFYWGQCLCVSGWKDDACANIHCSGLYSVEFDESQCKCHHCDQSSTTQLLWGLSLALALVGSVVFAVAVYYFAKS